MKITFCLTAFLVLLASCSKDLQIEAEDSLVGTWRVLRFEDEKQNTIMSSPAEEEIIITYKSSSFEGATHRNRFEGEYQVQVEKKIVVTEYLATEAEETEFGQMFYEAMRNAQMRPLPFEVKENLVKINYEEGKYMVLSSL